MKPEVLAIGVPASSEAWMDTWHRALATMNRDRLQPSLPLEDWKADIQCESEIRELEGALVEADRSVIAKKLGDVPTEADAFMRWFESLRESGPGQNDPLFPWLAQAADLDAMRWFLTQEAAGEAGFDDLVAMTQVRFPAQAKLELARNYWDEMGRGTQAGMHGAMLERTVEELRLQPAVEETVWESLALANTMLALASNRRYAYHSIGALGAIELTAPSRVSLVNAGLRRLGVSAEARRYFQLHAGLDIRHSEAWNREVIRPLVAASPEVARAIAEGALLRLSCGARAFARYRRELGVGDAAAAPVLGGDAELMPPELAAQLYRNDGTAEPDNGRRRGMSRPAGIRNGPSARALRDRAA